jgi:formylglycine-generating enzyme required for sulfatase activity
VEHPIELVGRFALNHPPDLTMLPVAERPAVLRALAKKPAERWPSCKAFVEALAAAGGAAPLTPPPSPMVDPPRSPTEALRIACPSCGARLKVRAEWWGKRVRCPACQQAFAVPGDLPTRTSPPPIPSPPRVQGKTEQPKPSDDPSPKPAVAGPRRLTNSLGMKLALIPAGTFQMGSPLDEPNRCDDEPRHRVEITQPFYLGLYEVTQEEYERVMGTNPSSFKQVPGQNTRRFPVESVSWHDAVEFCRKLSELPAEKNAGRAYRLPTEAEWEYACRGGASDPGPFFFQRPSRTLSSEQANFDGNYPYGGAPKAKWLERPMTVGSYEPNGFGLFDMHGNVSEWCQDWYGPYDPNSRRDPQGPQNGDRIVLRGGSWLADGRYCRAAYRTWGAPGCRNYFYGFRVVLPARTR